ncbi:MAG: hypothetical protein HKN82_06885 [Akkermansiaceae bacterium]|nr:hypothetical protein [Akkermansiaceae bacterium]
MITFLILSPWIAANVIAAASLALAFSRFRGSSAALLVAVLSGGWGLFLSITQGVPSGGMQPVHVLSWIPLLIGVFSILRWTWARHGNEADRRTESAG